MGCFNVAGTMSNLTIGHGDKIAFFPLAKSDRHYRISIDEVGSNLSSNEGSCILLKPYCAPVFGEYNDYGGIENIEETQVTKDLESYFGGCVEDIINTITGYNEKFKVDLGDDKTNENRQKELKSLQGMFEHKDVYLELVYKLEREDTVFKNGHFTDTVMTMMGFEFVDEFVEERITNNPKRYNKRWKKDNIIMYTDGRWIGDKLFIDGIVCDCRCCYNPKDVSKLIGVNEYSLNSSVTKLAIEDYRNRIEEIGKMKSELKSELKSDGATEEHISRLASIMCRQETFPISVVNKEIGSDEDLTHLGYFTSAMNSTNNFYFPAMSGEQHGNSELDKYLHDITGSILYEKLHRDCE